MTTANQSSSTDIPKKEHERRFVPDMKALPFDYAPYPMESILQGYINDGLGTRLRDTMSFPRGHVYTQTRKKGSGVSRDEDERELSREEFISGWKNVDCHLTKDRYFINYDAIPAQLNVYHGALEGYFQNEVEFDTHEEAVRFNPPAWLGREVTDDKAHNNSNLAKYGIPKD